VDADNRAGAAATLVSFDWHGGPITRLTPITKSFRSTQNVRRFFKAECGAGFRFDRTFMAWLKDGKEKTMGDAADEWSCERLQSGEGDVHARRSAQASGISLLRISVIYAILYRQSIIRN
jgi:hypothetical protein